MIEDNENDRFSFIYQTDEALKMMKDMIHSGGDSDPNLFNKEGQILDKKNPLSGNFLTNNSPVNVEEATVDSIKMQDLQRTNELLLKELRIANDKYFSKRQESKSYKEQITALKEEINEMKKEKPIHRSISAKRNLMEVTRENENLVSRIEKLKEE